MLLSKASRTLAAKVSPVSGILRSAKLQQFSTKRYYDMQSGLWVEISSDRQLIDSSLLEDWRRLRSKDADLLDFRRLPSRADVEAAMAGSSTSILLSCLLPPPTPRVVSAIEKLKSIDFDYFKGGIGCAVFSTKEIDLASKTAADAAHIMVDLISDDSSSEGGGTSLQGAAELVSYAKDCSLGSWITLNVNLPPGGKSAIEDHINTIDTQLAILADLSPQKIILRVHDGVDEESLRAIIDNAFNLDIIGSPMSSRTFLQAPAATMVFADKQLKVRNFCSSGGGNGDGVLAVLKMMIEGK